MVLYLLSRGLLCSLKMLPLVEHCANKQVCMMVYAQYHDESELVISMLFAEVMWLSYS